MLSAPAPRPVSDGHGATDGRPDPPLDDLRDRFLSTVSHELRTPLNAIIGWAQVLKAGMLKQSQVTHAIEAIDRNARVQVRMVNDLLDIARMRQGSLTITRAPLELASIVRAEVEDWQGRVQTKHQTLRFDPGTRPVRVLGDEGRLRQAIHQVLANSVKFTGVGGTIDVRVSDDGVWTQLEVCDSGGGVAADELPHLTEPFYQAPSASMRSGLGVGLSIVEEVVGLHRGTVRLESGGVGRGLCCRIRLPLTRVVPVAPVATLVSQAPLRKPPTPR